VNTLKAIAVELLALVIVAALAAAWGYHHGTQTAKAECAASLARIDSANLAELASTTARFRATEAKLNAALATQAHTHQQELTRVETAHQNLAARLRSGTVSVSIPAARCIAAASSGAAGRASAADQPARAELAPETAQALDRIATDGDTAIVDLNHCLAAYAAVRTAVAQATCTAATATPTGP
jgi:prophage endopeptidase